MITKTWLDTKQSRFLWIALLALVPTLAGASVAGHVQFVVGDVRIVDAAGKERAAQKGQEVNEGETLLTAAGSSAQLRMIDGGILALRPETQLKLDNYVFHGTEDGSENALLSLVKGGLRTITGLIGRQNKEKLKLRTPTATIGIRGTDHEPMVLLEPPPNVVANNPPGTYDKVNVGATSLSTQGGTVVIGPNQVGFAASATQAPVLLPKLPDFYRATPTPAAKQGQKQMDQSSTVSSSSTPGSKQGSTVADNVVALEVPAIQVASLTGVDSNGEVLSYSDQTLTTKDGQVQPLTSSTTTGSGSGTSGTGTGTGTGTSGSGTGTSGTGTGSTSGPAVAPAAGSLLMVSFPYAQAGYGAYPQFFTVGGSGLTLTTDGSGNLTSASISGNGSGSTSSGGFSTGGLGAQFSLTQTGATLTDSGSNAATGLAWGRWQGGNVTESSQYFGQDANGNWGIGAYNSSGVFVIGAMQTQSLVLGSGSLHWITTPTPVPEYLSQVLTGSATYTLVGGTHPTDQNGNVGTLNSASLGVNFTTQVVNAAVNFTVAGNTWAMQSGAMSLEGPQFSTYPICSTTACAPSNVSLTKNGVATNSTSPTGQSFGNMSGVLTGAGLNGAALEYSVQDLVPVVNGTTTTFVSNAIQGVAAFSGPAQNAATPFRIVGIADGWNNLGNSTSSGSSSVFNYAPFYHGSIDGTEQAVTSVVDSSAGLTSFAGYPSGYTAANSSVIVPSPGNSATRNSINIGTAVNTDVGSVAIGTTTISWGRWAGGSVNIYSLDGATLLGSIDNTNRSIHWVTSSSLDNTAYNLPLTGTATYTLAGNTSPTDFKGNVGTLTSATLSADFTNAKVNTAVNVSFNSSTNTSVWNLTADNVPLSAISGFKSDTALNGVNGIVNTVSCTGASCGGASRGYVEGHFFAGAQGVGMLYGMATGNIVNSTNSSGTSISTFTPINGVTGLVVMKR